MKYIQICAIKILPNSWKIDAKWYQKYPGHEGDRNENKTVSLNKSQTKRSHPVEKFLITSHIVLALQVYEKKLILVFV